MRVSQAGAELQHYFTSALSTIITYSPQFTVVRVFKKSFRYCPFLSQSYLSPTLRAMASENAPPMVRDSLHLAHSSACKSAIVIQN